ncbi:beta-mannosidase isoform X2 [Oratosquilla oratoria]|uniref:beta-mannosidase isoform X2 n=1 Tax=Oratosquilla oratoria TaxID=337810 RepID=UPI003F774E20
MALDQQLLHQHLMKPAVGQGTRIPFLLVRERDVMASIFFVVLMILAGSHLLVGPFSAKPGFNSGWTLRNSNGSISISGEVPGGVYSSLLRANVLQDGDFYYRYNDLGYRWVSKDNWTYSTKLQVTSKELASERVALVFEGLDTVAQVKVNDVLVGRSDNMFVRYIFDVKDYLKVEGDNDLSISFESPVGYAKDEYEQQKADYVVPPKCVVPEFRGECHANHIRKMQASFSWDWGPAFPNLGIWKPWTLASWNSLRIADVLFAAVPASSLPNVPTALRPAWNVTVKAFFDIANSSIPLVGSISVELEGIFNSTTEVDTMPKEDVYTFTTSVFVDEDKVDMWWPNGYGTQRLYDLTVGWKNKHRPEESSKSVRVGFRTVELNQDFVVSEDESKGRHYRVVVNNVTMFMKGSNWIPAHVLPEQVTSKYTKELLEAAANTHQNCIRVWGGGIYESDEFYKIADQLGILIWQDMMFACSMYPVNQSFLDSVTQEVETQVRRLQHHPSILLWAGNNENEAALRGNWYGTWMNFTRYKKDYIKLYVDTIRVTVQKEDLSRPFVVSSPNNGIESEEEGFIAKHPYDNKYGDVHYYNYYGDAWNWRTYPRTRFGSEYGFQSWPSFLTMKQVTVEEDWSRSSHMMSHRQHHPLGNTELNLQIGVHMHMPPNSLVGYQYFLYLSQVHQAVAIKTETEFYRRGMSSLNENGEGFTMGALYWQLNDIWQGASWSSIEFGGRWKMLHYYAKNFFAPVIASPWQDHDQVKVTVINDLFEEVNNVQLKVQLRRWDSFDPVLELETLHIVPANTAHEVVQYSLLDDLKLDVLCSDNSLYFKPEDKCFIWTTLTAGKREHNNFLLLGSPKDADIKKATLKIKDVSADTSGTLDVTLSSDEVALFVWLETPEEGVFEDNGFIMHSQEVMVKFYPKDNLLDPSQLKQNLRVWSLSDTYNEEDHQRFKKNSTMKNRTF